MEISCNYILGCGIQKGQIGRWGGCFFDLEGNLLTDITALPGDYLYNGSPCKLSDRYDVILSTFMNNREGLNDNCHLKSYIVDGFFTKEIKNNMLSILSEEVKWVSCCPGFIEIGGQDYVAYTTWNWSHDTPMPEDGVAKYYLAKVRFE